jgi:Protein of unknown function (DUF3071)
MGGPGGGSFGRVQGGRVRQLHVMGVSEDGTQLLLGAADDTEKVTHAIPLDERLRAAARGALAAPGADRAQSTISPREIQARLRAGASPDEVAKVAKVPVARVLPYFAPVEAERERVIEEARAAVVRRARGPQATGPLGEAVDGRLREVSGLKTESVQWSARRRDDGSWVVGVSYSARGAHRAAEWLWRPAERELTALDGAATRLSAPAPASSRKPSRRPRTSAASPARTPASRTSSRSTSGARVPAKSAAKLTAKPVAKPVKASKATKPAKAAPKTARTPAKTAAKTPTRTPTRTPAKTAARTPARTPVVEPTVAPTVEANLDATLEQAAEPGVPARRRGERVPLPSWSDVLLGVRGPDVAARTEPVERRRAGRRRRG